MCGYRHYSTSAVFHQDKIGNVNGHPLVRHGIAAVGSSKYTFLFKEFGGPLTPLCPFGLLNESSDGRFLGSALAEFQGQRVLHGQTHKSCPEYRVLACGVNFYGLI